MADRMEVIAYEGRLFISIDDVRADALSQYNDEFRTPEEARCAFKVVRWMERLLKYHQKDLPETDTLWRSKV